MARNDPLRNFRFRVEIDNVTRAGFSEVSGLSASTEVIEYREGTDPSHARKLSGLNKFTNITLKHGLTTGANALELFNWHEAILSGQLLGNRRKVVIVIQDESGQDQALRRQRRLARQVQRQPAERDRHRCMHRSARADLRGHRACRLSAPPRPLRGRAHCRRSHSPTCASRSASKACSAAVRPVVLPAADHQQCRAGSSSSIRC
jgi:phage tail-like protein